MDYEWTEGQAVIHTGGSLHGARTVATVARVTPSGLPEVRGVLYRKDGSSRGRSSAWSRASIAPATPEDIAKVRAEEELRSLRSDALALMDKARVGGGRHITREQWRGVIAALEGGRMTHHNLNARATVILTAEGARVVNRHNALTGGMAPSRSKGDTYTGQLWSLMRTFGPHLYNGGPVPFLDNSLTLEDS